MWDDDDYDPTAQINERVADAVAVIGIIDEVKKEPEPSEKAAEKKPKPAKPSTSNAKVYKDLSKAEIEELQKRGDMEMFASVLGMEVEKDKNSTDKPNGEAADESKHFEDLEKEIKEKEKAATAAKQNKPAPQKKKQVNKAVYDDYVEDEYDNYDDKFADY